MVKYIHIGYPKTMTSSLQIDFFSKHPQVFHLGVGCGSLIDYVDDEIEIAVENYILYAKELPYAEHKARIKNAFDTWFEYAEKNGYKAVGISLEQLSFYFIPGQNDTAGIAERLKEIFGHDTKIIALIRNQFDLLKSLYGQYVREGLSLSYKEFIDYCYVYGDRNFLYDLLYDKKYAFYADLFGEENVHFIALESIRDYTQKQLVRNDDKILLLEKLSEILHIEYELSELDHTNPSLNKREIFQLLLLNQKIRHSYGNLFFESANIHRNRKYFGQDPLKNIHDPFFDVKKKRVLLEEAHERSLHDPREVDYYADQAVANKLSEMFAESNKNLSRIAKMDLPEEYCKVSICKRTEGAR